MSVRVRPLKEDDLEQARFIMRLAFGTALGAEEPEKFGGDMDFVGTRYMANPAGALAVEKDGQLVGSNFAYHWGNLGLFGPLSIHPDYWGRGLARALLNPTMGLLDAWGVRHVGIYTEASSPKHLALYQAHGLWPRFLTVIMNQPAMEAGEPVDGSRFSRLSPGQQEAALADCRELTDAVYPGLDLSNEINLVAGRGLGDCLLLWEGDDLAAFAVCHFGPGSEGGSQTCYLKFGAARPGPGAGERFSRLLADGLALAGALGAPSLMAGVNLARHQAYQAMLAAGFVCERVGVAMQRPNEPAYNIEDAFVMDDWR